MAKGKGKADTADRASVAATVAEQVAAIVAPVVLGVVAIFRRFHPGGGVLGRCSYGIPGKSGIVVADVAWFLGGKPPETLTLQAGQGNGAVLAYAGALKGGGVLGRCAYRAVGHTGQLVFEVSAFLPDAPPMALTLAGITLAAPVARGTRGVTSAVVAEGNATVAVAEGKGIAAPATVAAVAAPATVAALANKGKGKGEAVAA